MPDLYTPLNFKKWIDDNRQYLKPPVGNRQIWEDRDFQVFVVGGPNKRTDYHINDSEEFFYQVQGDINLRVQIDGKPRDIPIKEGEIYLLPPRVPHAPQRPADTIGLVIEHKRQPGQKDGVRWYCPECNKVLYEEFFALKNIVTDLPPVFERFYSKPAHMKCKDCGASITKPT